MPLSPGDPAPSFVAATPTHREFRFDNMAGRYVVLVFMPLGLPVEAHAAVTRGLKPHNKMFDDVRASFFGVLREPFALASARNSLPGIRWFLDADGEIHKLMSMTEDGRERAGCVVLDPTLRVLRVAPIEDFPAVLEWMAVLPPPEEHAGVPSLAPALIVPRVFESEFCGELIAAYEAEGGVPSGFMVNANGRTELQEDPNVKRRRDVMLKSAGLIRAVRERLDRRLFPEVLKAFSFAVADVERYLVACYDAEDGGFFRAHRDNITPLTAYRRFAVTINLNAEDYTGGDLHFPEFSPRRYRAPTGGAVVFSCALLHEADVVTSGKRYAFLPFLYDQDGAETLQRLQHRRAAPEN